MTRLVTNTAPRAEANSFLLWEIRLLLLLLAVVLDVIITVVVVPVAEDNWDRDLLLSWGHVDFIWQLMLVIVSLSLERNPKQLIGADLTPIPLLGWTDNLRKEPRNQPGQFICFFPGKRMQHFC